MGWSRNLILIACLYPLYVYFGGEHVVIPIRCVVMTCSMNVYDNSSLVACLCVCVADILDRVSPKFHQLGLTYECLGGGRIDHNKAGKNITIYGYSVVSTWTIPY